MTRPENRDPMEENSVVVWLRRDLDKLPIDGRPVSQSVPREELYRRGVPRDCWDGALEGLSGPEEAIDAFLQKKLRGAELSDPKVRRRAADALARRGYRWEDISAGLRRYGAEPEEW